MPTLNPDAAEPWVFTSESGLRTHSGIFPAMTLGYLTSAALLFAVPWTAGKKAVMPPLGAPHNEFWVNSKKNDSDFGQISDVKSEGEK